MSEVLAGQVLRFQWNAYPSSWGPALRDLRTAGLFHDLTLVTADNTAVSAHKLVLAACSAFFKGKKYFMSSNNKNFLHIILKLTYFVNLRWSFYVKSS